MLPVIIACSVVGFLLILSLIAYITCCNRSCTCSCWSSKLRDDQRIEERLRRENDARIKRLNKPGYPIDSFDSYKKQQNETHRQVGLDFPQAHDDEFEVSSPANSNPIFEESALSRLSKTMSGKFGLGRKAGSAIETEHNVRVSKLPENFRQSIQPGLTPEMIFNIDTFETMKKANESAIPAAVVASHKALKMMGVNESDVQKPFSEPVTSRIERMAKTAQKQGFNVGSSTAGLGPEIAKQFEVKRKAQEERQRTFDIKKEESRIRAEIREENLSEVNQHFKNLRDSQKLSEADAKRLSQAATDRISQKKNKLKQFLETTGQ